MNRYMTAGVNERIPLDVQILCWDAYEQTKLNGEYDYLQVFNLIEMEEDEEGFNCVLTHDTEVPAYHKQYMLRLDGGGISEKIYIVDSVEYEMMLLAEEY